MINDFSFMLRVKIFIPLNYDMLSLFEIYKFINDHDKVTLMEYYNKCYENLKEMSKRSNIITLFLIIIFTICIFSSYILEINVVGLKIKLAVIKIISPLLLSYFVLEWCLIARRRRELMKVMKHVGFKVFNIDCIEEDLNFNHFGLHSRNVMPFSFMIELLNIDYKSKIQGRLFILLLIFIFLGVTYFIGIAFYISFTQFHITFPIILCDLLSIYCLILIFLFYRNEFKSSKLIKKADQEFNQILNNNPPN